MYSCELFDRLEEKKKTNDRQYYFKTIITIIRVHCLRAIVFFSSRLTTT